MAGISHQNLNWLLQVYCQALLLHRASRYGLGFIQFHTCVLNDSKIGLGGRRIGFDWWCTRGVWGQWGDEDGGPRWMVIRPDVNLRLGFDWCNYLHAQVQRGFTVDEWATGDGFAVHLCVEKVRPVGSLSVGRRRVEGNWTERES